jgi:hypothetical protein
MMKYTSPVRVTLHEIHHYCQLLQPHDLVVHGTIALLKLVKNL